MTTIHLTGDEAVTTEEAEKAIKNYTPGVQEDIEEAPDEVDNSSLSEQERAALDEGTTSPSPFPPDNQGVSNRPAVTAFIPAGEWVSPVQRHRQRQAMLLPSFGQINDLDQRITAVVRFDGAPEAVRDLAQKARLAVGAAREAREAASHPDSPKYTRSVEAKDEVVQKIAEATTMVRALEAEAQDSADAWFDSLVEGLDERRAEALEALRAAEKAYSRLRTNINAAQALAIESGKWDKSWHMSPTNETALNAPISAVRDAIRFLEDGDDYTDGSFLTKEYGGTLPPHTLAKLKRGADVSQPGSYARQLFARAKSPMKNDRDLHEALQTKHLVPFLNSSPLLTELMGRDPNED